MDLCESERKKRFLAESTGGSAAGRAASRWVPPRSWHLVSHVVVSHFRQFDFRAFLGFAFSH
jgi:hypothetical protein